MPELPEVETVRRELEPVLVDRMIARADIRRPDLRFPFPDQMAGRLSGQTVLRLGRRSKYLLADLDGGETLIIHLGMSGRLLVQQGTAPVVAGSFHHNFPMPEKHDHVALDLDDGTRVVFNDARRFGMMDLCATDAVASHRLLANLGPEPLGNTFSSGYLETALAGRKSSIKAALLDQRIVAGLGNIYVCEALFDAGIHPLQPAGRVPPAKIPRLVETIRTVLRVALKDGGSTLRDYRRIDGEIGGFQERFRVYGRAGQPCQTPGCANEISRIVQSGRSTFWCPSCQKPLETPGEADI